MANLCRVEREARQKALAAYQTLLVEAALAPNSSWEAFVEQHSQDERFAQLVDPVDRLATFAAHCEQLRAAEVRDPGRALAGAAGRGAGWAGQAGRCSAGMQYAAAAAVARPHSRQGFPVVQGMKGAPESTAASSSSCVLTGVPPPRATPTALIPAGGGSAQGGPAGGGAGARGPGGG